MQIFNARSERIDVAPAVTAALRWRGRCVFSVHRGSAAATCGCFTALGGLKCHSSADCRLIREALHSGLCQLPIPADHGNDSLVVARLTFNMIVSMSKSNRLLFAPCVVGLTTMLSAANIAHADWFQTYVAATCDAASGRGMVRFGYGDADDPPKFAEVEPTVDGGLSHAPVTSYDKTDASCSFPSGREIEIRYAMGTGVADTRGPWSVWVDKIRIIQADVHEAFPFAVIVEKKRFRKCTFHLAADQDLYDLTLTRGPRPAGPTPVECDKDLSPLRGARDLVEYPLPNSHPAPRAGSILVTSTTNVNLCRSMIHDDKIDAESLGTVIVDWGGPTYLHPNDSHGRVEHVLARRVDLTNTGAAQTFYQVNSGHTFTRAFFVLPPATVSRQEVTQELAAAPNFDDIPQRSWMRADTPPLPAAKGPFRPTDSDACRWGMSPQCARSRSGATGSGLLAQRRFGRRARDTGTRPQSHPRRLPGAYARPFRGDGRFRDLKSPA
jgi:hypothetical protein